MGRIMSCCCLRAVEVGSTADNAPPMQSVVQQYILEIEKLRYSTEL